LKGLQKATGQRGMIYPFINKVLQAQKQRLETAKGKYGDLIGPAGVLRYETLLFTPSIEEIKKET